MNKPKSLVISIADSECYITKTELWQAAVGHVIKAFMCWPLKARYGFRDWEGAKAFIENATICLKSSWSARWK